MPTAITHGLLAMQFPLPFLPTCEIQSWDHGTTLTQVLVDNSIINYSALLHAEGLLYHGTTFRCFLLLVITLLQHTRLCCMKQPISLIFIFRINRFVVRGTMALP